jgi:hypothetical protein
VKTVILLLGRSSQRELDRWDAVTDIRKASKFFARKPEGKLPLVKPAVD